MNNENPNEYLSCSNIDFRQLIERIPTGIILTDKKGIIQYANPACEVLFNRKIEALLGQDFGIPVELGRKTEVDIFRKNSSPGVALMEVFETEYKNEKANLICFIDITERKEAEQEVIKLNSELEKKVTEQQILLETTFDNSQAGIVIADAPDGRLRYVNKAGLLISNTSEEEIIQNVDIQKFTSIWNILHLDNTPYNPEDVPLARAVLRGETCSEEFKIRRGNMQDRIVWANAAPIKDREGNLTAGIVMFLDITDRKQAEEELLESEEKYRTLYETAGVGIGYYKLDGTIISYNKIAAENMGGMPADFVGKSIFDVFPKRDADVYMDRIKRAAASESKLVFEDKVALPIGDMWFLSTFNKIHDINNNVTGIQIISQDITSIKLTEAALAASKEAADAANIAKSEFLANMSHEIRTPMNGVMGMLQLMQMTELTEEQAEYIKAFKTSSDSLLKVINDILDYSKIESGKLKVEKLKFDLYEFISNIEIIFKPSLLDSGLVLNIHIGDDVPHKLIGDSFKLRQILLNLIGNAIKFTHKGQIDLVIRKIFENANNEIKLEWLVQDTGIGISQDRILDIFNSFSQADSSITRRYGGTGLGLTICKGLVEIMKGEIWAESKEGEGSRFYFTCVLDKYDDEDNIMKKVTKNNEDITKESALRLLIVEDDEINRIVIERLARQKGWLVTLAENGKEAIDAYKSRSFDVIIMDIQMPVLDGFHATIMIRQIESQIKKHTPIIAMTAYALQGDREKCLEAGMDDYLTKPIDVNKFYTVVEKFFKGRTK